MAMSKQTKRWLIAMILVVIMVITVDWLFKFHRI